MLDRFKTIEPIEIENSGFNNQSQLRCESIQKIFDLNRGLEYGALAAASDCARVITIFKFRPLVAFI